MGRLKAVRPSGLDFTGVHVAPAGPADVVDEWSARLVLLGPDKPHKRNDEQSPALLEARNILESRGSAPRLYRNMLVFLAAGAGEAESLELAVREHLAQASIPNRRRSSTWMRSSTKRVAANLRRTDETATRD